MKNMHEEWVEEKTRIRALFNTWPMDEPTKQSLYKRLSELEYNLGNQPLGYNTPAFHRWVKGG